MEAWVVMLGGFPVNRHYCVQKGWSFNGSTQNSVFSSALATLF